MAKKQQSKKIFIILAVIVPAIVLSSILWTNKDNIGSSKYESSTTLIVKGMTCESCSVKIRKSLGDLKGVKKSEVDLEANKATISYDTRKVDINAIKKSIIEAGYTVEDENKLEVVNYKIRFN